MASDNQEPPFIYEGYDPVTPNGGEGLGVHALKTAVGAVIEAIEAGKRPGMPLSVLSNAVREAPLGSLFVAFVAGMIFARRR